MPTIHDLTQSKFLKKEDVIPPKLVTVAGYEQVNVAMQNEPAEMKYVLQFHELEKPLVLNSTNGQLIAQITGSEDFDQWIGKRIVLFVDPNISMGGKLVGGIRARAPKLAASAPAPKPAPAPVPAEPAEDDVPF